MTNKFWDEEVEKGVDKLSKVQLKELLLDIWDTATVVYADETEMQRLDYIKNIIEKTIGVK